MIRRNTMSTMLPRTLVAGLFLTGIATAYGQEANPTSAPSQPARAVITQSGDYQSFERLGLPSENFQRVERLVRELRRDGA